MRGWMDAGRGGGCRVRGEADPVAPAVRGGGQAGSAGDGGCLGTRRAAPGALRRAGHLPLRGRGADPGHGRAAVVPRPVSARRRPRLLLRPAAPVTGKVSIQDPHRDTATSCWTRRDMRQLTAFTSSTAMDRYTA